MHNLRNTVSHRHPVSRHQGPPGAAHGDLLGRLVAALAALALMFSLSSCGQGEETSAADDTGEQVDQSITGKQNEQDEKGSEEPVSDSDAKPTAPAPKLDSKEMPKRLAAALIKAGSLHFVIPETKVGFLNLGAVGDVSVAGGDPKADIEATAGATFRLLFADDTTYIKTPAIFGSDKEWSRLTTKSAGGFGGLLSILNPSKLLLALQEPGSFEVLGKETIDGVPTQKYKVTLTRDQVAEWLEFSGEISKLLPKNFSVMVWMDANDLPRKTVQSAPVMGDNISFTTLYSGFGVPVKVTPPPASEVGDLDGSLPTIGDGGEVPDFDFPTPKS